MTTMTEFIDSVFKKAQPVIPAIKHAYFNNPVTVIIWTDGTKTIVRCGEGDTYDPEKGLAMAMAKKALGNRRIYYDIFKKWLPEEKEVEVKLTKDDNVTTEVHTCENCWWSDSEGNCGLIEPCNDHDKWTSQCYDY